MEAYENQVENKIANVYNKTRSWVSAFLGIIITVIGTAVVFVVASLEGTKEIEVSNAKGAEVLNYWRSTTGNNGFPEAKSEIIIYEGRQYYYMLPEDGDWYFAYDGGIEYIFSDYKFYVLTLLTIVISMYVSNINYTSTIRSMRTTDIFVRTLKHYQSKKEAIEKFTQYIPEFCVYKNKQAYEIAKRDVIEEAGVQYDKYIHPDFDINSIEDWQKKKLKAIKKIKVKKIHSSDLLQEQGYTTTKITLLPISQKEHQRIFTITGGVQKIISSALSGMVVAFGVVLGNWVLGITYGLTVLISFVSSIIIATDFVTTTLRNRYLAKADLLNEFDNIKETFINKPEEEVKVEEVKIEEVTIEEEKSIIYLPALQKNGIIL
jgi:hypothetical protein